MPVGNSVARVAVAGVVAVLVGCPTMVDARALTQGRAKPALLLILDSSGSMNADDGTGRPKIAAAKAALNSLVGRLPEGARVGLRVYGHRIPNTDRERGCRDTELITPVGPLDRSEMKQDIASFQAKGFTPIGLSLRKGAGDLVREQGKKTMILVSDGIATCPPPPCKVARRIVQQGIDLRIHTVGFQVDPRARAQLRCIARVGRGAYVDAGSADELSARIEALSVRALRTYEVVGTAVDGGPSAATAPMLEGGQFTDSIVAGDVLWYAVELGPGQSVRSAATLVGRPTGPQANFATFQARILDESLNVRDTAAAVGIGRATENLQVAFGPVADGDAIDAPGTYYVTVSLERDRALARRPYALELLVEITPEEPVETQTPPEPPPEAAGAPPAEDEGPAGAAVVATLVGCGLVGVAVGMAAVRRLRSSS